MFRRNKPSPAPTAVPADRIGAIAARSTPAGYGEVGASGRKALRSSVYKPALAILPHGERLPVVIKNMSETGVRIEYFKNTPLGDRVFINEPSVPLRFWADVVWEEDGAGGLHVRKADDTD